MVVAPIVNAAVASAAVSIMPLTGRDEIDLLHCVKLVRARGVISLIMNTICDNKVDILKFCLTLWDLS